MIHAEIRRDVLATFPDGTPVLVLAPDGAGYAQLAAERNDPALELRTLSATAAGDDVLHPTIPHVLVEGLDEVADPIAFLAGLRRRTPHARVFALIANAAHLGALGAFSAGRAPAAGHPLVLAELAPLFAAAGWLPLAIKPLRDPSLPAASALPVELRAGELALAIFDPALLERVANAAFLVIADPA